MFSVKSQYLSQFANSPCDDIAIRLAILGYITAT